MPFITPTRFPHHRLAAYEQALRLLVLAKGLCDQVPAGYASFKDRLLRAAGSVVANTGEGAKGRTPGEKRNAFGIARKELGEAAAWAEVLAVMGLVMNPDAVAFLQAADRVAGLLTGLIKRWAQGSPGVRILPAGRSSRVLCYARETGGMSCFF